MTSRLLSAVGALVLLACGKSTTGGTPSSSATATSTADTACDARLGDIDRVLASASNKCTTDQDCVCFRGGVSKTSPCGGITDAKTNERFEAAAKDFTGAGCKPPNVMCAAMLCEPKCNAGTCGPRQLIQ